MRVVRSNGRWVVIGPRQEKPVDLGRLVRRCGYRVAPLCDELSCSERYFRSVFLRDVGLAPKFWLRWERILDAKRRLREGASVSRVAQELGFARVDSFRREFLDCCGASPSRWAEATPDFGDAAMAMGGESSSGRTRR